MYIVGITLKKLNVMIELKIIMIYHIILGSCQSYI